MYGLCLYKYSPKYSLDPTNTIKAMEALQSFANMHPESKYVTEANGYVQQCRDKLEMKAASAAKLYYNIGQYKAASVAYKSVMRDYPESSKMDQYQYMEVRSLYYYAHESVKDKQEERYANMITAYHDLVDEYPKSSYLRDAEKYYTQADNHIKQLRDEHK
jgi:outer membrane protein assembly factor BamD